MKYACPQQMGWNVEHSLFFHKLSEIQKWLLQKSAPDDGVKIELRPVLIKFGANLSFPGLRMRLAGL